MLNNLTVLVEAYSNDGRVTLIVNGTRYNYECDAAIIRRALDLYEPKAPGKLLNMIKRSSIKCTKKV